MKCVTVLGIETSCDETAASVVRITNAEKVPKTQILSNIILSQIETHKQYGGVIPEVAARAHVETLPSIITAALNTANIKLSDCDAIAATAGPGLLGGLVIGLTTGRMLASANHLPFYAINHLEGHALTPQMTDQIAFPYVMLLVSGGHSQILEIKGVGNYVRHATTVDDALGEAFDKTAKLLGLPYPGGPEVEKMAHLGNPLRFDFPHPRVDGFPTHFSFAGLKTAVRMQGEKLIPLTDQDIADICAAFQSKVVEILEDRLKRVIAKIYKASGEKPRTLAISGGVGANKAVGNMLQKFCTAEEINLLIPPASLCTDNAAMIAFAGARRHALGLKQDEADIKPHPRWPLDKTAPQAPFAGKKA